MTNESELYSKLSTFFTEMFIQHGKRKSNSQTELCLEVQKKFGFPSGVVSDIVTMRTDMADASKELLYAITSVVSKKYHTINVEKYFSVTEIETYRKYRYKVGTTKFPITFKNMIEVIEDEQYIGKITVRELMELRDAQILNYNVDTQRPMTLKRGDNFEYYKITLNRDAVNQMTELFQKGDFISNAITLNLPPDCDISYRNGELTIKDEVKFDILDGYHRYIALSNLYNLDNTFDYPMELRVTFFNQEKAKQFIYQEAQRTPLSKADADSMNKNDYGVKICQYIRRMLGNDIVGSCGIINESLLTRLISLLYVEHTSYSKARQHEIGNQIMKVVNETETEVPELLDNIWTLNFTVMFFAEAKLNDLKGKELYDKALEKAGAIKEIDVGNLSMKRIKDML